MRTLFLFLSVYLLPLLVVCQLVDNYDTCRTQLYYQSIGSSNNKETHIEKARTVQDNGIVNAGFLRAGNNQNALIIKQNATGNVVWQKEYGNTAYDEQITDWRELANRQLLVAGIAKNRATFQSAFFMMLLADDGTIIWQKFYNNIAATSNINNAKIYPDYYGQYFFAVQTDSTIIYGMTDADVINWQKSFTITPGTTLLSAVSYYKNLTIGTNSIDSGFHVANFYYINYAATGNPKTIKSSIKLGGFHQNSHYIFHDYEQYGSGTYFSGIRSVNNAAYEIIRLDESSGFLNATIQTLFTPNFIIDSTSQTAINIYGDMVSFTEGRKNNRLNVIQFSTRDGATNKLRGSTYNLPDSIILKGNIKTWDNGYIFFGFRELSGANKKIMQLKTDSATLAAGCINRVYTYAGYAISVCPRDTVKYNYTTLHALADLTITLSINNSIVDTLTICREMKCPRLPFSDSCLNSYQKIYTAYEPGSRFYNIEIVNERTFVLGMVLPMDYMPAGANIFMAEINSNGQMLKQRKFVFGTSYGAALYKTQDNNFLVHGLHRESATSSQLWFTKIDTNLNIVWIKSLQLNASIPGFENISGGRVQQGSDGSFFLVYSNGETLSQTTIYLTKLDVNGNFLWSKNYRASYPGRTDYMKVSNLQIADGYAYLMAINPYNSYSDNIILKVMENDGALIWCKKYSVASEYIDISEMMYIHNGELLLGGRCRDNITPGSHNVFVKAGSDGNIRSVVSLKNIVTNTAPAMRCIFNAGKIYGNAVFYSTAPSSNSKQINVTLDNNFNIISSKGRPSSINYAGSNLGISNRGILYETGSYISGYGNLGSYPYLIKFSPDGRVGTCPSDTILLEKVASEPISVSDISCTQSDSSFLFVPKTARTEQFFLSTAGLLCASVPGCTMLDITGDSLICNKALTYTFRAIRNNGCSAPLQWLYNNVNLQVLSETNNSITLRFLTAGNWLLKARFSSNCTEYLDSFFIQVSGNTAPILNLGTDTSLCAGTSLLLNAKKGFRSYLWQDGSTDSMFNATLAGLYHVTVTDSCNNVFRDTINIQINGGVLPNLGPDSNFCNTNSIRLNVHRGFLNYRWQDGSTDSVFTAVNPGVYHVSVTDICNNSFSDTIVITAYRKAMSLDLGPDTLFCSPRSMTLNAGKGFKKYLWQDGSVDSVLVADAPGLFHVQVTDSCGNMFTDSIRIFPDTPITFDIGADRVICKYDSVLLIVPAGLSDYNWWPQVNLLQNNASAATVFPVSATRYYVSAIKQNGCVVTDSVMVNVHIPSLINLGPDSSICKGDSLRLTVSTSFNNYVWSTGEHTASVLVHEAGLYFVSATDNNHCIARDSFLIPELIPLPVTQLPEVSAICQQQPLTLHAGSGFAGYWWSNGAAIENISVNSVGTYWVTVKNAFGCTNSDTVMVNRELVVPRDFLKAKDSTICSFETITISPGQNYLSYLWSNGSSADSITIKNPGNYWLQVMDANGCTGRDTFKLAVKDCNIGVFFPTGFTPNNDGTNDNYTPRVYGSLNSYHINIYNRYGEKVFESRTITEGWDGRYKGFAQTTGAFIWTCSYQLNGESVQNKSGSLILIR